MAKKPAPKKAAKPAAKAASKKPAKKSAPAGKPAAKKPVAKKPAKPVAKKPAKTTPKKPAQKPLAKKSAPPAPKKAPAKPAPKAPKAPAKPVKAAVPAKPAPAQKPAARSAPASAPPPAPKPAPKPSPAPKPAPKSASKKEADEPKTNAPKPLVTQTSAPVIHKAAPMVKKQVSTLESPGKERYSDSELEEFRQIINVKLEDARKDYDLLKQTLANNDNNGTEDTSPSFKMIEDGSETLSREETAQLAARQEKFIKHLEDALLRIRNKTYGICRVTGRLISKERLRLVPHATLSIEAKQQMSN